MRLGLIGARMLCYINYTGCPSVIVSTLNLRNSSLSLVHLPCTTLINLSLDICHLAALSARRILTFSPFLGQRQSSVRALSVLLHRPVVFNSLPHQDIRSTDNISTFCRLSIKTFYFRNAFNQHYSDITRASDSTYFVDSARVKKLILTFHLKGIGHASEFYSRLIL